jgi:hypothetical protein
LQKRKADTQAGTGSIQAALQIARNKVEEENRQKRLKAAEAELLAVRAEIQAHQHTANDACTSAETAAAAPTALLSSAVVQEEPIIVPDDVASNVIKTEWEREVAVIHEFDQLISQAMSKGTKCIKEMLSYSDDMDESIGAKRAGKLRTIMSRAEDSSKKQVAEAKRKFLPSWRQGRPWLDLRTNEVKVGGKTVSAQGMFCTACEDAGAKNSFTTGEGCTSFKLDRIISHEKTQDHITALAAVKRAKDFQVSLTKSIMLEVHARPFDIPC